MFRNLLLGILLFFLSACVWESYEQDGKTHYKQKYPTGTSILYQDGTYSRDMKHNKTRPIIIPVNRDNEKEDNLKEEKIK